MRPAARLAAVLLAFLGAALLAGCETPRVFDSRAPDPLAELPASRAVLVRPVAQAPHPEDLAARLAQALNEKEEVPATARPGRLRGSYVLEGRAVPHGEVVVVEWTLAAPDGEPVGRFRQRFRQDVWYAPDVAPEAARRDERIREAAARVAALLAPAESAAGGGAAAVAIGSLAVPGDNERALRAALLGQLEARGVPVVGEGGAAEFVIDGAIRGSPTGDGRELVVIVWRVRDGNGPVGTVRQSQVMPAGRLAATWGPLAREVAIGAADGIVELLRQAGAKPAPASPFTGY